MKGVTEMKKRGSSNVPREPLLWKTIATSLVVAGIIFGALTWWGFFNSPPTAPVEPPPVVEEPPVPPIEEPVEAPPANFIVSDELWQNTFKIPFEKGSPYKMGIGFSDVPVGTNLYAPMDGYISITEFTGEQGSIIGIVLSTTPGWKMGKDTSDKEYLTFFLRGAEGLILEPKKGEAFAVIKDITPFRVAVGESIEKEIPLLITVSLSLGRSSDQSITDLRTYLWTMMYKHHLK